MAFSNFIQNLNIFRWIKNVSLLNQPNQQSQNDSFKLFLMGDSGTGKSCVLYRFSRKAFNATLQAMPCAGYAEKTIDLDGKTIKLNIWDAPGLMSFQPVNELIYKNSNGILLFYDITDKDSFDNIRLWMKTIKEKAPKDVEIILLGNKCELKEKRMVSKEMGEQLALEYGIKFLEISAKDDIRVEEAFLTLARLIKIKNEEKMAQNNTSKGLYQSIMLSPKSFLKKKDKQD